VSNDVDEKTMWPGTGKLLTLRWVVATFSSRGRASDFSRKEAIEEAVLVALIVRMQLQYFVTKTFF
jgi:hypothetical protein